MPLALPPRTTLPLPPLGLRSYPELARIHDLEQGPDWSTYDTYYTVNGKRRGLISAQNESWNKTFAKRTFHLTLAFGVLTLIYEAVSLFPAFHSSLSAIQGVNLQAKSEADSRQALTYSFLAECETRQAQNLPLGNDCIINLAKTPKAPPDIDDWMTDAPASRLRALMLMVRGILRVSRDLVHPSGHVDTDSSTNQRTWVVALGLACGLAVLVLSILVYMRAIVARRSHYFRRLRDTYLLVLFDKTDTSLTSNWGSWITWKSVGKARIILLGIITGVSLLLELEHLLLFWWKRQRWMASMDFLASCQLQSENNIALSQDCAYYLSRKLKPFPALDLDEKIGIGIIAVYIVILGMCIRIQMRGNWRFMTDRPVVSPAESALELTVHQVSYRRNVRDYDSGSDTDSEGSTEHEETPEEGERKSENLQMGGPTAEDMQDTWQEGWLEIE